MRKFLKVLSLSLLIMLSTSACSDSNQKNQLNKINEEAEKAKKELEKLDKEIEDNIKKQNEIKEQKNKKEQDLKNELEKEKKIRQDEAQQGFYVSNNKDYNWYIDQTRTGKYSIDNCVPACTAMILKFLDPNSKDSAESLRNEYIVDGKGWIPDIMLDALKKRNIKYIKYNFKRDYASETAIRRYVKNGYIAMFISDMTKINGIDNNKSTIGKRHNNPDVKRHTFIVKGYKYINNELYFEVYDPDSGDIKYKNGQFTGQNRYYKSSEVMNSVVWPHILFFK